jgi:hypothetical protein
MEQSWMGGNAECRLRIHAADLPSQQSELSEGVNRLADQKVIEHLNVEHSKGSLDRKRLGIAHCIVV